MTHQITTTNATATATNVAPNSQSVRYRIDCASMSRVEHQRHAAQPIGERLFPHQDVAAADLAAGVVVPDLARQVQPERDDLLAVPAGGAGVLAGRSPTV